MLYYIDYLRFKITTFVCKILLHVIRTYRINMKLGKNKKYLRTRLHFAGLQLILRCFLRDYELIRNFFEKIEQFNNFDLAIWIFMNDPCFSCQPNQYKTGK